MARPLAGNGGRKGKPQTPKALELSDLEIEALQWATSCVTHAEIGDRCGVSRHAIRSRLSSAYLKLGVSCLHLAILAAYRNGDIVIATTEKSLSWPT